jgi:hypothetical protein
MANGTGCCWQANGEWFRFADDKQKANGIGSLMT